MKNISIPQKRVDEVNKLMNLAWEAHQRVIKNEGDETSFIYWMLFGMASVCNELGIDTDIVLTEKEELENLIKED